MSPGIVADLSDASGTEPLFTQLSRVDILGNNLGTYEPKQFVDITDEDWLRLFQVNVMSGMRLARHYLPGMLDVHFVSPAPVGAGLVPAQPRATTRVAPTVQLVVDL
jgi:NAD(P)-dependent dehydrogenase (short-subunit alcohol dehydrogenase family)